MSTIATIKNNEAQNGIEIYFKVYPLSGTKETMKKNGFRWNRKKGCWYAIKSMTAESIADIIAETSMTDYEAIAKTTGETITPIAGEKTTPKKNKAAQPEKINLENLGENAPHLYGAELAAAIREDLKKRGVKGVTVRKRDVTYDTGITVTVKATAADIVSVEEYQTRYPFESFSCDAMNYHGVFCGDRWIYSAEWETMTEEERRTAYNNHTIYYLTKSPDFNKYHQERKNYPSMTTAFYNKVVAVFKIANQWNYDNSDSMTDYFDVGYYLDINVKTPEDFEPVENMTDEEKTAYNAEKAAEEAAEAARLEQFRKEQEEREKAYKAAEQRRKANEKKASENIIVEDLSEAAQFIITNLSGGIGKECNIDEVKESIAEHPTNTREKAVITRKVTYTSEESFEAFGCCLMSDFDFLVGKGGTGSDDVRLEGVKNIWELNEEQRNSVEWYMVECVAVYVNDELRLVINPEGHNYARYTYIPTETSEILPYKTESDRIRKESEKKTPFYFPETIEKQAENITIGDPVTVYMCDGWSLNSIYGGMGIVTDIQKGNYAQYNGIYLTLQQARNKQKKVFLRNGKKCLIYKGIKEPLPESITKKQISENMSLLYNADEILPQITNYYSEKPLIDTIQR